MCLDIEEPKKSRPGCSCLSLITVGAIFFILSAILLP